MSRLKMNGIWTVVLLTGCGGAEGIYSNSGIADSDADQRFDTVPLSEGQNNGEDLLRIRTYQTSAAGLEVVLEDPYCAEAIKLNVTHATCKGCFDQVALSAAGDCDGEESHYIWYSQEDLECDRLDSTSLIVTNPIIPAEFTDEDVCQFERMHMVNSKFISPNTMEHYVDIGYAPYYAELGNRYGDTSLFPCVDAAPYLRFFWN